MSQTYKELAVEALTKKELLQVLEKLEVAGVEQSMNKAELSALIMSTECGVPYFVTNEAGETSVEFSTEEEVAAAEEARMQAEMLADEEAAKEAAAAELAEQQAQAEREAADLLALEESKTEMKSNVRLNGNYYLKGQKYNFTNEEKRILLSAGVI